MVDTYDEGLVSESGEWMVWHQVRGKLNMSGVGGQGVRDSALKPYFTAH